jgi:hypothetical protein
MALIITSVALGMLIESDRAPPPSPSPGSLIHADYRKPLPPAVTCPKDPLVLLVTGQSNAANYGSSRAAAAGFTFFRGSCYPASDPLPGSSGTRGSMWTRLIPLLHTDRPILLVPVAIGSTRIEEWGPGGMLNDMLVMAVNRLHDQGLKPDFVLVVQGESDATVGTLPADYRRFAAEFLKSLPGRRYMALASRCKYGPNQGIRAAQLGAIADAGAMRGPDLDAVTARQDGCHFDDEGLRSAAQAWANVLNPALERATRAPPSELDH